MKFFGLNITLGLILVAAAFYVVGARYPGLYNKAWGNA